MTAAQTLPDTIDLVDAPDVSATSRDASATSTGAPRRARRAVSYCNIWDLVAPGQPCPACENSFEQRLARAAG